MKTTSSESVFSCSLNRLGRFGSFVLLATFLFAFTARAADELVISQDREWRAALEPIRSMPVQDFGFIRSGATFADNHLQAITGKRAFGGAPSVHVILALMAKPEQAAQTPLLRVMHPEMAQLFGGKHARLAEYRANETQMRLAQMARENQDELMKPLNELETKAVRLENLERDFAIVPREKTWLSPASLQDDAAGIESEYDREIATRWGELMAAIREDDPDAAAQAASALANSVRSAAEHIGAEIPALRLDVFYQEHQPFRKSALFYLLGAIAFGAALFLDRKAPALVGYGFLILGLGEQVVGIIARWILSGRAPLSNMYESFTFATAGMILVAIVFEALQRKRIAGLGGGVLGFILMTLAHKAPIFDSQIRPLMPALQSSWLTYHVAVIMLSYSAFLLSFFFSIIYLAKDAAGGDDANSALLKRLPDLSTLDVYNYRIIAVGFPLLTLGIIFGAVWAETAWGRPWGFDPKETWSAITWLVYAIYLHVRYMAGWRGRRAAILAIIGFACVLFTYIGVNYLLPGLHSYV